MTTGSTRIAAMVLTAASIGTAAGVATAQTSYTVSVSRDYTGPFANVMES